LNVELVTSGYKFLEVPAPILDWVDTSKKKGNKNGKFFESQRTKWKHSIRLQSSVMLFPVYFVCQNPCMTFRMAFWWSRDHLFISSYHFSSSACSGNWTFLY